MLESALGTDLERFGDYQTRLVKLNPKLGSQLGEGAAPAAPTTSNTPAAAAPVTAPSGVPPVDQTDAPTPGIDAWSSPLLDCTLVLSAAELLCIQYRNLQHVLCCTFANCREGAVPAILVRSPGSMRMSSCKCLLQSQM